MGEALIYETPAAAVLAPNRWTTDTLGARRNPAVLGERILVELATATDLRQGVERLIALLRRSGLARGEWWAPVDNGRALRLELADGDPSGARTALPLGPAGTLVLVGAPASAGLLTALTRAVPLLRRRWTDEQLATHAARLARENAALDDFATLVAHDLKSVLLSALRQPDPSPAVEDALELVDSILDVARAESAAGATAEAARCLEDAVHDLGRIDAAVAAELAPTLPIPPAALRLLLRNLLRNAVAAGSKAIRVSTRQHDEGWALLVDDDGVGLEAAAGYSPGSGLGLALCRRLASRLGGSLELAPRPQGGTRATLLFSGSAA